MQQRYRTEKDKEKFRNLYKYLNIISQNYE